MSAILGMVLFFALSGFLTIRFLLHHPSVVDFLIRRFFRVVPLAWLGMITALLMLHVVHPLLAHIWLGSWEALVKYAKRPALFVAILVVADVSTFFFEHRSIAFGKRLRRRLQPWPPQTSASEVGEPTA
jgi:peptidoglycan/LPS O-acetylase OafA/YrhL